MGKVRVIYWNIEDFGVSNSLKQGNEYYVPLCNFIAGAVKAMEADILIIQELRGANTDDGTEKVQELLTTLLAALTNTNNDIWFYSFIRGGINEAYKSGVSFPDDRSLPKYPEKFKSLIWSEEHQEGYTVFWRASTDFDIIEAQGAQSLGKNYPQENQESFETQNNKELLEKSFIDKIEHDLGLTLSDADKKKISEGIHYFEPTTPDLRISCLLPKGSNVVKPTGRGSERKIPLFYPGKSMNTEKIPMGKPTNQDYSLKIPFTLLSGTTIAQDALIPQYQNINSKPIKTLSFDAINVDNPLANVLNIALGKEPEPIPSYVMSLALDGQYGINDKNELIKAPDKEWFSIERYKFNGVNLKSEDYSVTRRRPAAIAININPKSGTPITIPLVVFHMMSDVKANPENYVKLAFSARCLQEFVSGKPDSNNQLAAVEVKDAIFGGDFNIDVNGSLDHEKALAILKQAANEFQFKIASPQPDKAHYKTHIRPLDNPLAQDKALFPSINKKSSPLFQVVEALNHAYDVIYTKSSSQKIEYEEKIFKWRNASPNANVYNLIAAVTEFKEKQNFWPNLNKELVKRFKQYYEDNKNDGKYTSIFRGIPDPDKQNVKENVAKGITVGKFPTVLSAAIFIRAFISDHFPVGIDIEF